jgi:acyl-CoA synthetase (AMP-forming)/AMP-acid ligase II
MAHGAGPGALLALASEWADASSAPASVTNVKTTRRATARHPPCTINDLLAASVRAYPAAPAIVAPGRADMCYDALARQLAAAAITLAGAGFGRGSRIALALPDGPEHAVAALAVCGCATAALVSLDLDEETLQALMVAMRLDALIAADRVDSPAVRAAQRAGVAILRLRALPDAPAGTFALHAPADRPAVAVQVPEQDDVAMVTHTSGTTSTPKIVPHTQRRMAEAARTRVELGRVTRGDRSLLLTPVSNVTSFRRAVLPPLAVGGSTVCPTRFDPDRCIDWLEQLRPTYYMASAARHMAILESIERRSRPVAHCLRFALSGGANLPPRIQTRLEHALGATVIQGYGMTETGNIAQWPLPPDRAPPGSVGRPSNIDIAITDEDGGVLGTDELGEVVVRGPEVFDGYENNPEANALSFRDGWFRTGDLGRIDRDGFLFLAGRIKDVINRGGAKVSPAEVEEALAAHPRVAQAAAFALPHPTLGEDVAAAVVLRAGTAPDEEDLREFARTRLAAFKVPTRILSLSELPRGSFDKVKRDALAAIAADALRQEYVPPRDEREAAVTRVFADVLGVDRVGAFDDFFQLGGDSLRAMRAAAQLESHFGVAIGVDTLFRKPMAATLTAAIGAAQARGPDADALPGGPVPRATRHDGTDGGANQPTGRG